MISNNINPTAEEPIEFVRLREIEAEAEALIEMQEPPRFFVAVESGARQILQGIQELDDAIVDPDRWFNGHGRNSPLRPERWWEPVELNSELHAQALIEVLKWPICWTMDELARDDEHEFYDEAASLRHEVRDLGTTALLYMLTSKHDVLELILGQLDVEIKSTALELTQLTRKLSRVIGQLRRQNLRLTEQFDDNLVEQFVVKDRAVQKHDQLVRIREFLMVG